MSRAGGRNKIFLTFLDVFAVQAVFSMRKVSFAMASPFGFWSHRTSKDRRSFLVENRFRNIAFASEVFL